MTSYFQHVGEKGAARDFPKTLGTQETGLKYFQFADVEPYLSDLSSEERQELQQTVEKYAPEGFQIWGIPAGARNVLAGLRVGDALFLLEAAGYGGSIGYAGRVIARPSLPGFHLSKHLWGEERFPLILFLKGGLTNFPWDRFCEELGYSLNWNPAGQTYRLQSDRIARSSWQNERALLTAITGRPVELEDVQLFSDVPFLDDAELDAFSDEGLRVLREHLSIERSSTLVRRFKARLSEFRCTVCSFDFKEAYGELGSGFIEAHHVLPLAESGPRKANVSDLRPVCSNCHRMLHRRYPAVSIEHLRESMAEMLAKRH